MKKFTSINCIEFNAQAFFNLSQILNVFQYVNNQKKRLKRSIYSLDIQNTRTAKIEPRPQKTNRRHGGCGRTNPRVRPHQENKT